jgi:ATP-dependent Clp protease protease subunit
MPVHPLASSLVPIVIEHDGRTERAYDIFSRLLKDRIIFINGEIHDYSADLVIAQMLFLRSDKKNEDINIYIHSPGGSVTAGLAIYDTMQFMECDVATYCIGMAASMGAVLLTSGTPGKRYMLPNAKALLHQPWGGMQGTASDISIHAEELLRTKKQLNEILAKHTGQPIDRIETDTDRDFYMSAAEAKTYGLVDNVLAPLKGKKP